jgi:hypothetical protein
MQHLFSVDVFCFGAEDWTQYLSSAKYELYHWAIASTPKEENS